LRALPTKPTVAALHGVIVEAYADSALIDVARLTDGITLKTLDAEALKDTNRMKLYVFGNDMHGQARLCAVLDNLGKGASGAAVQNLNLMLGLPETAGLV
jgi:N-acetyl-gamma-glutamyl-phosphate reductase